MNTPGHSKAYHIGLKECLGNRLRILCSQRHHLQPTGELIHYHQHILMPSITFQEWPQYIQMYSIPRVTCLKVLQWSSRTPWLFVQIALPTRSDIHIHICCHPIPVSSLPYSSLVFSRPKCPPTFVSWNSPMTTSFRDRGITSNKDFCTPWSHS